MKIMTQILQVVVVGIYVYVCKNYLLNQLNDQQIPKLLHQMIIIKKPNMIISWMTITTQLAVKVITSVILLSTKMILKESLLTIN